MCQYMSLDGRPSSWHESHYAGLATSTGAVIVEATSVSPIARVTQQDLVLDHEDSIPAFSGTSRNAVGRS